jgi:hypothetical protein
MMFSVCESERRPASETDIGINPFGSGLGVYHGRAGGGKVLGGKFVSCEQG